MLDSVKSFYVKFVSTDKNRYKKALDKLDKLTKKFGQERGDLEIKSEQDEIWYRTLGVSPSLTFRGEIVAEALKSLDPKAIIEHGIKRTLIYNSLEDIIE